MPVIHTGENLPPVFRIFILISVIFLAHIVVGLLAYGIVATYQGYRKRQRFRAIKKASEDLETRRIDYKAKKPVLVLPPATFSVNPIAFPVPAHFPVRHKPACWASTPAPLVRHTPPASRINNALIRPVRPSRPSRPSGRDLLSDLPHIQDMSNDLWFPLANPETGKWELGVVSAVSNKVAGSSVAVPSCRPRLATVVEGRTVNSNANVDVDAKITADEEHDTLGPLPDIIADKQRRHQRRRMVDCKKRKHWILDSIPGARAPIPPVKLQRFTATRKRTEIDDNGFLADTEQEQDTLSLLPVFSAKKRTKRLMKKKASINKRTHDALDAVMAVSAAVPSGKSRLATEADRRAATDGAWTNVNEDCNAFNSAPAFGHSRHNKLGKRKGRSSGGKTSGKRSRTRGKENIRVRPHKFEIPELHVNARVYAEIEAEEVTNTIVEFYHCF
ncbi:hypothetical protein AX17_001782 [Amanita inopinata Kibby_2008]|nr:hypothetical protein AX17_001782 [Amanita inopinata Kibby_2008]